VRFKRRASAAVAIAAAVSLLALAGFVAVTQASPASGVTPTVLARGTYDTFKVKTPESGPIDVELKAKTQVDIVVRKHEYLPHSSTGWHAHPGPVLITVVQGQLTFYEADDPTCTPHVVSAGQGYVDTGQGHIGRNETDQPALDISVILAPVAGAFRTELPAPNPNCGF
jgi:quercetin dioxygenase-like cupin family protein